MQWPVFNTILEVRVINMVDHCGYGLFHRIAWYHRPIQIIGPGASDDLCWRKHLLDVSIAAGPYKQLSRAAVFADDGQEAVGVHYPHNFPSMFLLMYAATAPPRSVMHLRRCMRRAPKKIGFVQSLKL
jgi:hypothetical protein